MAKLIFLLQIFLFLLIGNLYAGQDSFKILKEKMSETGCNRFEFVSILHSDLFNSIDSSFGSAVISNSGYFMLDMGQEIIIYDGSDLYNYSIDNNQVTIENQEGDGSNSEVHKQITFLTNLDEYYLTKVVVRNAEYALFGKDSKPPSLPDSVRVLLNQATGELDKLEFYDINEDLNQFIFINHEMTNHCDSSSFILSFPDSVDVVRY